VANDKNGLGEVYLELRQFARARQMFEEDHNPVRVIQAYHNDYILPHGNELAIKYGQEAMASGRMVPQCLIELAEIYYKLGWTEDAFAALDRAASFPGYESEAHLRRGRLYFYLRDFERAQAEFLQVKADDFAEAQDYERAQEALQTIARYEGVDASRLNRVQPARNLR
jgi:tetratricopeptide (TPR) repeat protein